MKKSLCMFVIIYNTGIFLAADMEEQVCPVIMVLSSSDSMDDFRTEAVAVSSTHVFTHLTL